MKFILLFVAVLAACILWPADTSLAQCPEDPNDNGICDTLYVEVYPPDVRFIGPGHAVRVPIYVTHDLPGAMIDSIAGMVIPLYYTHTNPTKYCSLSVYWNVLEPYLAPSRSVFRDLNDTTHNRFLEMYGPSSPGWYYDFALGVSTEDQHFWLTWIPQSPYAQRWWEGSRVLAATMTFRVEDTMTVCLDTCFLPISGPFKFMRSDAVTYVPRDNMPYCFSISSPAVGDVNADGVIDIGDVVYLINYLYRFGPAPTPLWVADVNCDGVIELGDEVYLVNYLFYGGPAPCESK